MDSVLTWCIVIGLWSLLLFGFSHLLNIDTGMLVSVCLIFGCVIIALLRFTVLFLQWAEVWPYIKG